ELRLPIRGHDAEIFRALIRVLGAVVELVARTPDGPRFHQPFPRLPIAPGLKFLEERRIFRAMVCFGREAIRAPFGVDERTPLTALQPRKLAERNRVAITRQ